MSHRQARYLVVSTAGVTSNQAPDEKDLLAQGAGDHALRPVTTSPATRLKPSVQNRIRRASSAPRNVGADCENMGMTETRSSTVAETFEPIRLLSQDGAAFAIRPVPTLVSTDSSGTRVADLELLSPDRLVRYLGRNIQEQTLKLLADAWLQTARDNYPEQSVATVQDHQAGLAVSVIESSPFDVVLEFLIISDLDSDIPDHDGISFNLSRTALIDGAHAIGRWLA